MPKSKIYFWTGGIVMVGLVIFGVMKLAGRGIEVSNPGNAPAPAEKTRESKPTSVQLSQSPLTGEKCATGDSRPFAVMVSSDAEARPLSGIGEADWVFELPVVPNGFTRMMAVYQCGRPREIGSIRSSRLDFVPLALGLNAIYAHFGGEHTVLQELNDGIIDNIDGLKYDGTYYYRKPKIPRPHNSFTNFDLLTKVSQELGYSMADAKVSYQHETKSKSQGELQPNPIFGEKFKIQWQYDKQTNGYFRSRAGRAETDRNTGQQVQAKNVLIMKTTWSPISKDYIRVKTVGGGGLLVYRDGAVITGTWEKKTDQAKLYFYDQNHREISLAPGAVWLEIDAGL